MVISEILGRRLDICHIINKSKVKPCSTDSRLLTVVYCVNFLSSYGCYHPTPSKYISNAGAWRPPTPVDDQCHRSPQIHNMLWSLFWREVRACITKLLAGRACKALGAIRKALQGSARQCWRQLSRHTIISGSGDCLYIERTAPWFRGRL